MTHSHSSDKQNLDFFWQPPENVSTTENVTFYGTLALTRDVFWMKQETNSLGLAALENEKPVTNDPTSVSMQEQYSHFWKRKGHIMIITRRFDLNMF